MRGIADATQTYDVTEWKRPGFLATPATAYAEAGEFDKAVAWPWKATQTTPKSFRRFLPANELIGGSATPISRAHSPKSNEANGDATFSPRWFAGCAKRNRFDRAGRDCLD